MGFNAKRHFKSEEEREGVTLDDGTGVVVDGLWPEEEEKVYLGTGWEGVCAMECLRCVTGDEREFVLEV